MRRRSLAWLLGVLFVVSSLAGLPSLRASSPGPPATQATGFISGPIAEAALDWNGNGLTDAVNLSVPVTLNVTAHWRLFGFLSANGTTNYNASDFSGGPGTQPVILSFLGWLFRFSRWNGSFSGSIELVNLDSFGYSSVNYTTATYDWTRMELRAELADKYAAQAVDANGDGFYDYLEVTGQLHVGVPGAYNVSVSLFNVSGTVPIIDGFNRTVYAAGYTLYHVWLDGNAIRQAGIDGPYRVDVGLCISSDCLIPGETDTFLTLGYTAASFDHHPIAVAGNVTDEGVDTDSNGKYESLRIIVPVNVTLAGVYDLTALLQGPSGYSAEAQSSATLAAGPGAISVDFSGWSFRSILESGPFTVQLFIMENISTYTATASHTTGAYGWDQFDSPYGLLAGVSVTPSDTDGNGLYNLVFVNTTVNAKVAASFQVQLTALVCCTVSPITQTVTIEGGPGPLAVSMAIPGWTLGAWQVNGSYSFNVVLLVLNPFSFDDLGGAQMNFTWDAFDPAAALRGPVTFHPVDTDGDGLWNRLEIGVPLQVNVAGSYMFNLQATSTFCGPCAVGVSRFLALAPGAFDLNLSLSGVDLRMFGGDAHLTLHATLEGTFLPLWTGVYPIPDPSVFQAFPLKTLTFHLSSPSGLSCCPGVTLVNYSNAYVHTFSGFGADPSTIAVTVPILNYTLFAEGLSGFPSLTFFEGLALLATPLPATVNVPLEQVGVPADGVQVQFSAWSAAVLVRTRTLGSNPGARLDADLWDVPDGLLTDAEILNAFTAWGLLPLPAFGLRLDNVSLPQTVTGPDSTGGSGAVVGGGDLQFVHTLGVISTPSGSLVHEIGLSLAKPSTAFNASADVLVPSGWVVSGVSVPPGTIVSGLGTGEVRVLLPSAFAGTAFVNLTARWASSSYLPAMVTGRLVGIAGAALSGAAVSLQRGTTLVNSTSTDSSGRFEFGSLAGGTYMLEVRAAGYRTLDRNVSVASYGALDLGTIGLTALPTTGGLTGRVTDADANGIAGASLRLVQDSSVVATTVSDSAGFFNFSAVAVGSYRLLVNATGFTPANVSVTIVASQVADLGAVVLQRLPAPPVDLSWAPWVAGGTVAAIAAAVVAVFLVRRRTSPPDRGDSQSSPQDERKLK